MSRSKEHRFQVAGKEREKDLQNSGRACVRACSWGGWIGRKKEK